MERISTFLESSTIHGLTYISTTRKYARIFWILVVLAGFSAAGYMIYSSFQSWDESPIKTTVETLPIDEIKFPKVTVCPPRNTYTDLNYDLMLAENVSLTEEMKDELVNKAEKIIDEHTFMGDLDVLQEDDRYYNWYYGYSEMRRSYTSKSSEKLVQKIFTSATSGVITTQYFDEQFNPSLERRKVYYGVRVYPPESVRKNKNVTLHFNLERLSNSGMTKGSWDDLKLDGRFLELELTSASSNFTPPAADTYSYRWIVLDRNLKDDFKNIQIERMPGFRFSWYYSGLDESVSPDSRYSNSENNRLFIQ